MGERGVQSPLVTRTLKRARARRNPSDIAGFEAVFGCRSRLGVTQAETAHLAGVSRRWYNALEAGRPANYSDAFLYSVRRILDLNAEEWDIVYRLTRGHSPAAAPVVLPDGSLPDPIRTLVEQSATWAVYLSDHRWDILSYNPMTLEYFPWMKYGLNVMEWALTWPEARAQLINWQDEWALPMIAQLRVHAEQWRHDERLSAVIEIVRANPEARRLWDSPSLPAITHPVSGQPRRLYLPRQGGREFAIRLIALTPMELPSCRMMVIIPA